MTIPTALRIIRMSAHALNEKHDPTVCTYSTRERRLAGTSAADLLMAQRQNLQIDHKESKARSARENGLRVTLALFFFAGA